VFYTARGAPLACTGLIDLGVWEIGRSWCHPKEPRCSECYAIVCRTGQQTEGAA
jgi:endonuclease III